MESRLPEYLAAERLMLAAERDGRTAEADRVRDDLDALWYTLTDEEHAELDARANP